MARRKRNKAVLALLIGLGAAGCVQAYNSSTLDKQLFAPVPLGTPEYEAAKAVFSQSCVPCHSFHGMTAAELVAAGYAMPGGTANDLNNSKIYYRMANSGGPNGPKNMPPSGAVSNTDLMKVQVWIESL